MIIRNNPRKKILVARGQKTLKSLKNCNAQEIQFYSILSKSKAALAERTIRSKKKFNAIWKTLGTSTSTTYCILSQL